MITRQSISGNDKGQMRNMLHNKNFVMADVAVFKRGMIMGPLIARASVTEMTTFVGVT